jgi:hypothetical protein
LRAGGTTYDVDRVELPEAWLSIFMHATSRSQPAASAFSTGSIPCACIVRACALDVAEIVEVSLKHKETLCPRHAKEYIAMATCM